MGEGMTDEEILDKVVDSLKLMLGSDPYSKGSYTHRSPDVDFDDAAEKLSRSVQDKVFFAGEHTSYPDWSGTTVGAIESGQAAARSMTKIISSFSDDEDLVIGQNLVFRPSSSSEEDTIFSKHDNIAITRTLP